MRNLILFDLDETLVLAKVGVRDEVEAGSIGVRVRGVDYRVWIRPFAVEMLLSTQAKYAIGLYTAADQQYADAIVAYFEQRGVRFAYKLYRQDCELAVHNEKYVIVKPLSGVCRQYDMNSKLIVDNNAQTYIYNKRNAIPIKDYAQDEDDLEMLKLQQYLHVLDASMAVVPQNVFSNE